MVIAWVAGTVILLGAALWGPLASQVEHPNYKVFSVTEAIEIRDYAPQIIAEVTVKGDRSEAINDGFRLLADYIFGNNTTQGKVAMTAPVTQQPKQKIPMTAPVTQQQQGDTWTVRFIMPSSYTMDTLPKPNNAQVQLRAMPSSRHVVIRFSGRATANNLARHEQALRFYMDEKGLQALGPPTYAFYNPPWTLPPLRRNEVMIEIKT